MTVAQFMDELRRRRDAADPEGVIALCDEHLPALKGSMSDQERELVCDRILRRAIMVAHGNALVKAREAECQEGA